MGRACNDTADVSTILELLIFDSKENLQLPHRILRTGDLEPKNIERLALPAMVRLILLQLATPHWPRFYSFEGLMGLCNIKNLK